MPTADFRYRIFNSDGGEVEQCGNGARCFVRFVRDQGLTGKDAIRVETLGGLIAPRLEASGEVTVDMGAPAFDPAVVPFDTRELALAAHWRRRRLAAARAWPRSLHLGAFDGKSARGAGRDRRGRRAGRRRTGR